MDFAKYYEKLPSDLEISGKEEGLKLLKLFAFNYYFDADELCTDEVNDATFYSREKTYNIDGVYVNKSLEEDTIELVYSYFVGHGAFSILGIKEILDSIYYMLSDALDRKKFTINDKQIGLLNSLLDEVDNKKVIIRVITDYVPTDETELSEIKKAIGNFSKKINKGEISLTSEISFGDDIQAAVDANIAPYEWVESDALVVDNPSNILKFGDNSFVCNISAKSLQKLWKKEGKRGLLAMNLRYHVTGKNVDSKIKESIQNDPKDFWYLNNGIIIVCNDYSFYKNELRLKQFSIVNGGQTSSLIGETNFDQDFYIVCKVIKNVFEKNTDKNVFISKVAEASNTQKPIKSKDIIANRVEQRNLKELLYGKNIFVEIKRGDKGSSAIYKEPWQKTKNHELAQDLYSFVFMQPGPARNNVSKILSNEDKYDLIFRNNSYSADFLKSILFIEKAYKEYTKYVNKDENTYDADMKGLIKNGLFYCLATIGYLLKLYYSSTFKEDVHKYQNNDAELMRISSLSIFDFYFIKSEQTYKDFSKSARDLFDYIFRSIILPVYKIEKSLKANIVYSNWTKVNTGFVHLMTCTNTSIFDNKNEQIVEKVGSYFALNDSDKIQAANDLYISNKDKSDSTSKNKKDIANNSDYNDFLNDLLLLRFNYSKNNKLLDSKVLSDAEMKNIILKMPKTKDELIKIVKNGRTIFDLSDEILKLVIKYQK